MIIIIIGTFECNLVNEFLVSKETGAASVGEIKTKIWFYQRYLAF